MWNFSIYINVSIKIILQVLQDPEFYVKIYLDKLVTFYTLLIVQWYNLY